MPVLLIDGDQYLYRCCAATERDVRWDEQNHVLLSNEEEAWDTVSGALRELSDHFGTQELIICLGQAPYFRHVLFPAYKPGRGRKPMCYSEVRDRLKAEHRCVEMPGLEADDVMGILATKPGNDNAIIVARDKDMKGVPTKIWDGFAFHNVSEVDADIMHMTQTLTGDVTDGYKGCPGIGPVKAKKIIQDAIDANAHTSGNVAACVWPAVVDAFRKSELGEGEALLQARLARILRWSDWDRKKKEPILWSP